MIFFYLRLLREMTDISTQPFLMGVCYVCVGPVLFYHSLSAAFVVPLTKLHQPFSPINFGPDNSICAEHCHESKHTLSSSH